MIIPVGHESDTVRRLPWITFIIMAICIVVHLFISGQVNKKLVEVEEIGKELIRYYFDHPYLELDTETKKLLFGNQYSQIERSLDIYRYQEADEYRPRQEEEQAKLDELSQNLMTAMNDTPYRKYGFIPAEKSFLALLTYMFIHGGLLHLLGNLLLLYLTGPFIEDIWGRPIYAAFYLTMGISSGFMFALHYPHFSGPLIGASGAIAGIMGAFLVRYWKVKITFFYFFFFFLIRGTFKAPAWLMLPLWVALEFFNAQIMDSLNAEGGGGVAHWVHVWGFAFGVLVALGMKHFQVEEKHIHPKIEAQIDTLSEGFKVLDKALTKESDGDLEGGYTLLLEAARKNSVERGVIEGLWSMGVKMGREEEAAEYFIRFIEGEIKRNKMDLAVGHFRELKAKVPQATVSLPCRIMLLQQLKEIKEFNEAAELTRELLGEVDHNLSPGLLLSFANTALVFSPSIAEKVVELCLQHPEIPQEQKDKLKFKFDELYKKPPTSTSVSYGDKVTIEPES
ncbi:MAG: rhomboid family intramembrane serine protease [Candidatus Aminicenantes bacterium]|nr:rhomboid family intramembrane serine protease [Candidatus Aminicenantes bacterium]